MKIYGTDIHCCSWDSEERKFCLLQNAFDRRTARTCWWRQMQIQIRICSYQGDPLIKKVSDRVLELRSWRDEQGIHGAGKRGTNTSVSCWSCQEPSLWKRSHRESLSQDCKNICFTSPELKEHQWPFPCRQKQLRHLKQNGGRKAKTREWDWSRKASAVGGTEQKASGGTCCPGRSWKRCGLSGLCSPITVSYSL